MWVRWKEIEGGKRIAGSGKRRTFPSAGEKCFHSLAVLTLQNPLSCGVLLAPGLIFLQVFISFAP